MYTWKRILGGWVAFFIFFSVSVKQITLDLINIANGRIGEGVSFMAKVYAEVFYKAEEALKLILPGAKKIKKEAKTLSEKQKKKIEEEAGVEFHKDFDKEFKFFKGLSAKGEIVGYASEDKVPGKWGPIEFMIGFSPTGEVTDIVVLSLSERRGRPVKERKFLSQFVGKTVADPLKLKKDIRGIAGATISSRGMTEGIKKALYVFKELYLPKEK